MSDAGRRKRGKRGKKEDPQAERPTTFEEAVKKYGEHDVYDVWKGADLVDFFNLVATVGYGDLRFENHYTGDGADRQVWIHVFHAPSGELLGCYNYSLPCPPFCNGD